MSAEQSVKPPQFAVVKYARYRAYERQRIETNDAVMGLLAGSRIAAQTLTLTEGSQLVLGDIFPSIDHIERFNLRVDRARAVLLDAEQLLGVLAVPQVLALHEDLLKGMIELAAEGDPDKTSLVKGIKAANAHDRFEQATGIRLDPTGKELFSLIRVARNTHIHAGGLADGVLIRRIADTSNDALAVWHGITGRDFPTYAPQDKVTMGLPELIGTMAVTKRLAEEANVALQKVVPRRRWAAMVVDEVMAGGIAGNANQRLRRARGVARQHYSPLRLIDAELEAAFRAE